MMEWAPAVALVVFVATMILVVLEGPRQDRIRRREELERSKSQRPRPSSPERES